LTPEPESINAEPSTSAPAVPVAGKSVNIQPRAVKLTEWNSPMGWVIPGIVHPNQVVVDDEAAHLVRLSNKQAIIPTTPEQVVLMLRRAANRHPAVSELAKAQGLPAAADAEKPVKRGTA
jgi:hypothetical protein